MAWLGGMGTMGWGMGRGGGEFGGPEDWRKGFVLQRTREGGMEGEFL